MKIRRELSITTKIFKKNLNFKFKLVICPGQNDFLNNVHYELRKIVFIKEPWTIPNLYPTFRF